MRSARPLPICVICGLFPDHRDRHRRWVLLRMMDDVVGDDALRFVIVTTAGVQVAIEPREVAARNLNPNTMSHVEVVACGHRLKSELENLARLDPGRRMIVAVSISHPLNSLVQ